ncbi:MAG: hypothetical protein ACRDA3_00165 [Peptostreptococcaceae bacterium]
MDTMLGMLLGMSLLFNILYVVSYKNIIKTSRRAIVEKVEEMEKELIKKYGER